LLFKCNLHRYATVIIFLWGPVDEIHVIVSLASLALLICIALKLRRTVDAIIEIEHTGAVVQVESRRPIA
jgi:hypothetical protein